MQRLLLILTILFISACTTSPKVFTDFDQRVDFTKYKTFTWVHSPPMLKSGDYLISGLAEQRMTNSIKDELVSKGFEFVEDTDNADFSVVYTMGARDKIDLDRYPYAYPRPYYRTRVSWGWGTYYYPYFRHYPFGYPNDRYYDMPRAYTEGTIAIDIFDANSQKPIWHSKASKRLSSKDINSNATNAAEVAQSLLANFPPQLPANIRSPWQDQAATD